MRICMITTFYPPDSFGGDALFVQRLARALVRWGHQVEVIHCMDAYRALAPRAPHCAAAEEPGIIVHRLRSGVGWLSPLATQQTGRPLFKRAAIERVLARGFDLINYHNISLVGGPGLLELGEALKLYTLHDYWLVCPTNVLFRDRREACEQRACLRCQLCYRRPPQLWRHSTLLPRALEHVDHFLAPSRFAAERHRSLGIEPPMVHLPHFVPAIAETPAPARPPRATGEFLYVGRLEWLKGLQTLLPIFLRRPDLRLLIAGQGTAEKRLRRLAAAAPNIEFLGQLSGGDLQGLYRRATALLIPSLCYEIYPLVALEAMRAGTPVLARDIGSLPEVLRDGRCGILFRDAEECEHAMDRLLGEPALGARLGKAGRRCAREKHTEEIYLRRYLALAGERREPAARD